MKGISYKALRADEKLAIKEAKGVCDLCDEDDINRLVIDHCHETDIVRGVLCGSCNLRIGWIEGIDHRWAKRASGYLGYSSTAMQIAAIMRQRFEKLNQEWIAELEEIEGRRYKLQAELDKSAKRLQEIERYLDGRQK